MKYNEYLIEISDTPKIDEDSFSIACIHGERLSLTLNGIRCYLDGYYLLCLNPEDSLSILGGHFEGLTYRFLPFFYNVNLNQEIISLGVYEEMRLNHGYPDFHLFRIRDDNFFGILPIMEEEYKIILEHIRNASIHVDEHAVDPVWSCRARSELISILQLAESAYLGKQGNPDNEILRFIQDHLGEDITLQTLSDHFHTNRTTLTKKIKEMTGLAPLQYIMEERLIKSRPDLLFTMLSLEEIAEKYGFCDTNYFNRMFKKRFGISPHRYRVEGQSERIRNEHIYTKKAKTMLQVKQFEKDIRKGLGRAVLLLQNETDKEYYRQAVIHWILDGNRGGRSCHGQYEADLIKSFPDWEEIAEEIVPPLLDAIRQGKKISTIPILIKLDRGEKARETVEELYREAYGELLSFTKDKGESDDRYPPCSKRYFAAAAALGRYLKADRERIKEILLDMADLYRLSDSPVIPTYQNPLFTIRDGIGKSTLFAIADEVAAEHPHGHKVHPAKDYCFGKEPAVNPNITVREIMESNLRCENYGNLWVSFRNASPEIIQTVAEEIVRQTVSPDTDMEKLVYLMSFFERSIDPDILPPPFPLDPTPILRFAEQKRMEETERLAKDKGGSVIDPAHPLYLVYSFLSGIRHPIIRTFFTDVLTHSYEHPFLRKDCAIHAVWRINFIPEDGIELERFVRTASGYEQSASFDALIGLLREQVDGVSDELIRYLFEEANFHLRHTLVSVLRDTGRLWEESLAKLREECLYDENEYIRGMAQERSSISG